MFGVTCPTCTSDFQVHARCNDQGDYASDFKEWNEKCPDCNCTLLIRQGLVIAGQAFSLDQKKKKTKKKTS